MKRLFAVFFAGLLAFAPVAAVAQTVQGVSISAPSGLGAWPGAMIGNMNFALAKPTAAARLAAMRSSVIEAYIAPPVVMPASFSAATKKNLGRALAYIAAALQEIGGDEARSLLNVIAAALQVADPAIRQGYNDQMATFETARNVAGYQQKRTGQTIFYPDGFGSFVNPNAGSGNTVVSPK